MRGNLKLLMLFGVADVRLFFVVSLVLHIVTDILRSATLIHYLFATCCEGCSTLGVLCGLCLFFVVSLPGVTNSLIFEFRFRIAVSMLVHS